MHLHVGLAVSGPVGGRFNRPSRPVYRFIGLFSLSQHEAFLGTNSSLGYTSRRTEAGREDADHLPVVALGV